MSRDGRTGVVLPVPEADPVLSTIRQGYPDTVPEVPAHITLLYPFVPADGVDEENVDALDGIFRAQRTVPVTLAECRRHEDGFVHLPVDSGDVTGLIETLRTRWPDVTPDADRRVVTEPHVTVASGTAEDTAARIQTTVTAALPIVTVLQEAWLVTFTDGRWRMRERFLFAGDDGGGETP